MNISILLAIIALLSVYTVFSFWYYLTRLVPQRKAENLSTTNDPLPVSSSDQFVSDSQAEWQRTFNAIIDPVLILDRDMSIVRGNTAAYDLLSVNNNPIEGRHCYQLFAGSDTACSICPVQTVKNEGKSYSQEINHPYLGRVFNISCAPITKSGEIVAFVHTAKDITHQRNLEKQLVQAHKMESIATLAGGIAHDFNNILGAILGNADLLLFRLDANIEPEKGDTNQAAIKNDEIVEHIEAIRKAGNRAKVLVSQILAFSRQSDSQQTTMSISPIIKEACKLLRASLPSTIEVKVSLSSGIGPIHADPSQIQQVFMNLGTNAAQALEGERGAIDISLREIDAGPVEVAQFHGLKTGKYVVLTICDTGKGMSQEMIDRIFDPFFTTREVGDGTGMGLAVLHGIIVSHQGVIDVKSDVGKGSVFTVFFPRVQAEEETFEKSFSTMPVGTETILFVDDEEEIVKMRTNMLQYLGYRVLPAVTPEQALQYFEKDSENIDMVITDHTMPRMTGLQLAAELTKIRKDIPIILCSGYSEAIIPEEAMEVGVRRFLAKPQDMRLMATAIRELLSDKPVRNRHENSCN